MEPLCLDKMNEADLREEFVAPLLRLLGYSTGAQHSVSREVHLRYPNISLGRKKDMDPPLRGRVDYICEADRRVRWTIETKPPSADITVDDVEQAYSYANHPEIRAVYFCLTNGHEFRVYQTSNGPASDALEIVTQSQLVHSVDVLRHRLAPEHVLADWPQVSIPQGPALAPGLRSFVRVLGGRFDYEETPESSVLLQSLSFSITEGFVQRNEQGGMTAEVRVPSPLKDVADFSAKAGIEWQQFISADPQISCEASRPTVFVCEQSFVMPRGLRLPFGQGTLPQDIRVLNKTTAVGHLKANRVFGGTFSQVTEVTTLGRQRGKGAFSLFLG